MLQVALGASDESAARWAALQPLDIDRHPTGSFAVLPPLYERLAVVAPDDPQLPLLHGTYRSTWYRSQLLLERLAQLLPQLSAREVDALVVGGAAAVRRWYPSLGSRPFTALELIVSPDAIAVVRAACVASGWRPAGSYPWHARFVGDGAVALVVYAGAPAALAGPLGPQRGYEVLRERARVLSGVDGEPLVLDVTDELLRLAATGARTVLPPSCQWLIDVHRLLSSDEAPTVEAVIAHARQFRVLEPLRATLLYLAETLGTPEAEGYLLALADDRGSGRERVAFRLAGTPAGRLTAVAQLVAEHLHASADGPLTAAVTRFPHHLQEKFRTGSPAEAMALGLRKGARFLR
jgi:hypothetical protein